MKLITYIEKIEDVKLLKESSVSEAIISTVEFSRYGRVTLEDSFELATACRKAGIKAVFEWDILMTENVFVQTIEKLKQVDLSLFNSLRLQDPGAINYALDNFDHPIQLILETGSHNTEAIKTWKTLIGEKLERIVLSLELSKDKITQINKDVDVDFEYLSAGRILLFYTPRSLVSPLFVEGDSDYQKVHEAPIEVSASSEESPHKGFPVIENRHGTFMFNTKDHFVLDFLDEVVETGIDSMRVDLRFSDLNLLKDISSLLSDFSKERAMDLKERYPGTVIRGYFHKNKSDALFKKLKNYRIQRSDQNFVGDVIDVIKKKHIGIVLRSRSNSLSVGDSIKLLTPDGKEKVHKVNVIRTSDNKEIESATHGQIVFIPHVSGISIKTVVYKES